MTIMFIDNHIVHNIIYRPLDNLSVEGLVRLWAHEALRLFQDRLVEDSERQWTDENIDTVAMRFFPGKYFINVNKIKYCKISHYCVPRQIVF